MGWEPKVLFREGLKRTIDWYYATKDKEEVKRTFGRMRTERYLRCFRATVCFMKNLPDHPLGCGGRGTPGIAAKQKSLYRV